MTLILLLSRGETISPDPLESGLTLPSLLTVELSTVVLECSLQEGLEALFLFSGTLTLSHKKVSVCLRMKDRMETERPNQSHH